LVPTNPPLDSSLTEKTFGLAPTELEVALRAVPGPAEMHGSSKDCIELVARLQRGSAPPSPILPS
jgi:hypothetical protein